MPFLLSYKTAACLCLYDEAEANPHASRSCDTALRHRGSAGLVGGAHRVHRTFVTLTHRQHIFACALEVHRQHGAAAPVYVAEQIGALAIAGDAAGTAMWKEIASALDEILRPAGSV